MNRTTVLIVAGLAAGLLAFKLMKPKGTAGTGAKGAPNTPNTGSGLFSGLSNFFATPTSKGGTYPVAKTQPKAVPQTQTQPWYNNGQKAVSAPQPQPTGLVGLAQQVSAGASIVNSLSDIWGNINPFGQSDEETGTTAGATSMGSADEVLPDPYQDGTDFVGPPAPEMSASIDDNLGSDYSGDYAA